MKKRIISALLATLTILSCIFGMTMVSGAETASVVNENMTREQACIDHMTYVATSENGVYELYVAQNTDLKINYEVTIGEIAIKNTLTGEIILSNPTNTKADAKDDKIYRSQLLFEYYDRKSPDKPSGNKYSSDASKTNVIIDDDGKVTVEYYFGFSVGDEEEYILPEYVSYKTWEWMKEQKLLLEKKVEDGEVDFDKDGKPDKKFPGATKTNFEGLYIKSLYVTDDFSYKLDDSLNEYLSISIDKIADNPNYETPIENTVYMIAEEIVSTKNKKKQYSQVLEAIGFTKEMMEEEYENISYFINKDENANTEENNAKKFVFSVSYEVNDDGFNAVLNTDKIQFESETCYISSVTLLPFMSAAKKDATGYTFLPDGSGVLIRFEEAKSNISKPVYGDDFAYYNLNTAEKFSEQTIFPVFGLVDSSNANAIGYFAVIEKGDTLANIDSRNDSNYHSASATFKLSFSDKYDRSESFSSSTSDKSILYLDTDDIYRGECSVKYTMLMSDYTANAYNVKDYYPASYIGMASCYRDYLYKNGSLTRITNIKENTKFFLEAFGSIPVSERILTFPVTVNKELTTFEDVKTIYNELNENGINNISFILTGFANGGLYTSYPTKISWVSKLGGAKGFESLLEYAKQKGFTVSPNFDFQYIGRYDSNAKTSKMASRTLDNRYTTKREYASSMCTYMRTGVIVNSTASLELTYQKFLNSAKKYKQMSSIAPRTLGSALNSDFNKDKFVSREDAKNNVVSMLESLKKDKGYKMILDKGNAYTLRYASAILNVGIDSSMLSGTSETIPFVGLVLHASKEFAGKAINTEGDERHALLRAFENGSLLYYTIAKNNVSALKNDYDYNAYYSVSYDILKDQIIELYNEYNSVMKSKQNKLITEHEFLNAKYGYDATRVEDGAPLNNSRIVRVEYENGEGLILNYNSYTIKVVYNGETYEIPSLSYATYTK